MFAENIIGQISLGSNAVERADLAIIGLAFVAQALKEWGIPSPGVTQSSLMYAGWQLTAGSFLTGAAIIVSVFSGSLCGSAVAYCAGRFLGPRFVNRFGKYLHLTPEKLDELKSKIGNRATPAIMLGRFVPTMMATLSVAAGMMRIPMAKYSAGVALAVLLWESLFVSIGALTGKALSEVRILDIKEILPALLVAMLGAFLIRATVVYLIHWRRKKKANSTACVNKAM
ncbi:MAG: DedA family protein [Dehalococcoidia bacterium]|nr:MAG: DedA family protein [Dehalococcoidia bacterium]